MECLRLRQQTPRSGGETLGIIVLEAKRLQSLDSSSFLIELSSWHSELRRDSTVATEQEAAAKATSDGANEAIHSVTDAAVVLVADWFPSGEMAVNH